jgi:hypothetical protein
LQGQSLLVVGWAGSPAALIQGPFSEIRYMSFALALMITLSPAQRSRPRCQPEPISR